MPISIRSRLLLLVMAALLPALAGALWVMANTYRGEREARMRALHDQAVALSMVVDRELMQRAAVARTLSMSAMLDKAPALSAEQLTYFDRQARHALQGLQGWVELRGEKGLLLSTRLPPGVPPGPGAAGTLTDTPRVGALERISTNEPWRAALEQPVHRGDRTVLTLAVTILPIELQRIVDAQRLPTGWVATVIDHRGQVVARWPGGAQYVGRAATPDLVRQMEAKREGAFESIALDGQPVSGYFATTPQGWSLITAMPRAQITGQVGGAMVQLLAGGTVLLALAAGGALWMARRIAAPVVALGEMAEQMQAGLPVKAAPSGLQECDKVAEALADAAQAMQGARVELERQVDDAIRRTREAEQRASHNQRVEALGRLTGGVAHDVNNLLGVISNSAYLIERRSNHQAELQAPVAATLRAVDAGRRLTQHLLRFSGRHTTKAERQDLGSSLPELQELLAIVLGRRISVTVKVAPRTRPVLVDAGEMELALINLALNARDALPQGGQVWIAAANADSEETADLPPGDYVVISVTDNGKGIDDDTASRAFEPFFTTKDFGLGSGLGLSQVHGFCVEAGGQARIAGTPGMGTAVSLLLPAAPPPGVAPQQVAMEAAMQASAGSARPDLAGLRVLVVDDNEALGDVTAALLASYGCSVQPARSAEQALAWFTADEPPFDAVLSDIVMPGGMDGVALARQLRDRYPDLPLVLISGYSHSRAPVTEFTVLNKPCKPEDLAQALRRAVAARSV